MKKIKSFLKSNIKVILAFIIGGTLVVGVKGAILFSSNQVLYKNTKTVDASLDELFTEFDGWIDPKYIDVGTLQTNSRGTILASSAGMCFKRNNKVSCIPVTGYDEHHPESFQQAFSDVWDGWETEYGNLGCSLGYYDDVIDDIDCYASDFSCHDYHGGTFWCEDCGPDQNCHNYEDNSNCYVNGDGYVNCT